MEAEAAWRADSSPDAISTKPVSVAPTSETLKWQVPTYEKVNCDSYPSICVWKSVTQVAQTKWTMDSDCSTVVDQTTSSHMPTQLLSLMSLGCSTVTWQCNHDLTEIGLKNQTEIVQELKTSWRHCYGVRYQELKKHLIIQMVV